jgi:MFS family permease
MRSRTARTLRSPQLCALNAGIQVVWGAILAVSLQQRSIALGHGDGIKAYATIAASGAFVATIVQLFSGPLSDRERARSGNRQIFYAVGVAIAIPTIVWFYGAPNFGQLVAAFLLLECAINITAGPYQAVIADFVAPDKRGGASSWMAAYQSIGNAAGLIIAGFVHDLRLVAVALGAALAGTYAVTARHIATLTSPVRPAQSARKAIRGPSPLRGPLAALLVSRGAINLGFFTLLGFLLFFIRESLGVSSESETTETALLFLTFTLMAIVGAGIAARPTDRYDKRLIVTCAISAMLVALAILVVATSLPVAFAAAALAGAAWGGFVTADWALASAVLPQESMATAMSIWNVSTTLPQVVAPLLAAPLFAYADAHRAGFGPRAAIALAMVEFAIGAITIWRLPRV